MSVAPVSAPVLPMIIIGGILIATFVAALFLGVFHSGKPYNQVHEFIAHDLGVIGVIVGTSILVEIAAASGLFHFVAIKLVKLTGGKPVLLLPTVYVATLGSSRS